MSAFGSYATAQTLDFTALGNTGIYLITGETGAGKTTIFDAISFALFGKASGDGRDRLRSDFAADGAKTFVDLDFACGDSLYNIRRTIKKSGQDVALALPDGTSVSGERNVKPKIAEIIGLERDQFAQIVMLAQNDFMRFLQSGTDERLKILRRIFNTEGLRQFQERLKSAVKRESDKRALILHEFARHGLDEAGVYKRGEQFAKWERQVQSGASELSEAERKLAEYDKRKQVLAAELAIAEQLRKKFAELDKCRNERDGHDAGYEQAAGLKRLAANGETALYKIKPLADEARKSAANYSAAASDLAAAEKQESEAVLELEAATQALKALAPLAEAQEAFAVLSKEWETAGLSLSRLRVLRNDFAVIADKQTLLSREQAELEALNADFKAAGEKYLAMQQAFLLAQAGIMAGGLNDGEPCPVCGATEHPAPAKISGGGVTEAALDKAKHMQESEQARFEAKSAVCGALKAEAGTLLKRFESDLSGVIPGAMLPASEWESSESKLMGLLSQAELAHDELSARREAGKKALDLLALNWAAAAERKAGAESGLQSARTRVAERAASKQKLLALRDEARAAYTAILQEHNIDEAGYNAALITEGELAGLKRRASDYDKRGEQLARDIGRLEAEVAGKKQPDVERLRLEAQSAEAEVRALSAKRDEINVSLSKTASALSELKRAGDDFEKAEKAYAALRQLAGVANGKLDFETYAQMAYFERVLRAANQRLKAMSRGQYTLLRKADSGDGRKRSGLELEVFDAHTGKARPAGSLSGGESFMASLALALGLSDIVQQSAGGIRIDAMFIDEGFGTLDADTLELAVKTLSETAGANRLVGIISHVTELRERIETQVRVEKTTSGSKIYFAR